MISPALISSQRCSHLEPSSSPAPNMKESGRKEQLVVPAGPCLGLVLGLCHQGEVPHSLPAFIQPFHLNELLHLLFQHERKREKESNGPGAFCALRGCLSSFGFKEK